jgi:hypothetical protein
MEIAADFVLTTFGIATPRRARLAMTTFLYLHSDTQALFLTQTLLPRPHTLVPGPFFSFTGHCRAAAIPYSMVNSQAHQNSSGCASGGQATQRVRILESTAVAKWLYSSTPVVLQG